MVKRIAIGIAIILISSLLLGGAGTIITQVFKLHTEFPLLFAIVSFLPLVFLACIFPYVINKFFK